MIPTEFIVALALTTLLLLYKIVNIPNKYVNTILATALSFGTSIAWCIAIADTTKVYACIMAGIVSILLGLVILVFVWHDSIDVPGEKSNERVNYTLDTLIGVSGIVESSYGGDLYLCSLNDSASTNIVVYLEEEKVRMGDTFTVTKIKDGKIFGRIISA